AAESDAFFVRPDDHLEWVARARAGRGQRFHHAERRQRAEIPIEIAAARHRVDVRSEHDGWQRGVAARASAQDVAGYIDPRLEAGGLHQADDVLPALEVGVGIGDATDAVGEGAASRAAEDAERLEPLPKAARIDARGARQDR